MVHVKQYAKNELAFKPVYNKTKKSFTSKIDIYWNDTIWKNKKTEHEYWDAPWEIEAFGREIGLYRRFLEHVSPF
jgi:hypothetical protein